MCFTETILNQSVIVKAKQVGRPKIKKILEDTGFIQFTSESTSDSGSIIDHTYFKCRM